MSVARAERQATVASFDPALRTATVLFDDGSRAHVPASAVDQAGLLLLRPGQRVRVQVDEAGRPLAITLLTLPFSADVGD